MPSKALPTARDNKSRATQEPAKINFLLGPGSAEVRVNGEYWGMADELRKYRLIEPGRQYEIRIEKPGYRSLILKKRPRPGEYIHINQNLKKLPGAEPAPLP